MTKYELMKKTEVNGDVWYYIRKNEGYSVDQSWTLSLEKAEKMLAELEKLQSLRQTGVITEEEFENLKKNILNNI